MAAAGTSKNWDSGGLTFSQPSAGTGGVEAEDVWDDRAILKAFDDALNSHTRKPVDGVEARKWNKHAAKAAADQPLASGRRVVLPPQFVLTTTTRGMASSSTPAAEPSVAASPHHPTAVENGATNGHGQGNDQGFQAADRRFASLLAKGNAEALSEGTATASGRGMRAGIPGPWEPVAGSSEGPPPQQQQYQGGMLQDDTAGQRYDYARPGPHVSYPRPEEYGDGGGGGGGGGVGHGANGHPYSSRGVASSNFPPPPPHPLSGGGGGGTAPSFEDGEGGLGRNGLPPPPAPPHPGVGPHAAAFQSLDGVPDDDLADLLLAWYYSGYYTGRYRAMQEARKPRAYRRHYHPPHPTTNIPPGAPAPPTPSTYHAGGSVGEGDGWGGEPQGWHGGHQQQQQQSSSPAGSGRGSISTRVS